MRTRITLILLTALLPALLLSQQKYVPGYIVSPSGDTLKGEIKLNEKKPQDQYLKVMFRDSRGMQKTYKPGKITAYGFESSNFIARDEQGEPAFYRVVTDGHIDLLELKYEGLRMNKATIETEYFLAVEGEKHLQAVKERNFRKQLASLMSDNEEIAGQYPDEKQFEEEAALSVINEYNSWKTAHKAE